MNVSQCNQTLESLGMFWNRKALNWKVALWSLPFSCTRTVSSVGQLMHMGEARAQCHVEELQQGHWGKSTYRNSPLDLCGALCPLEKLWWVVAYLIFTITKSRRENMRWVWLFSFHRQGIVGGDWLMRSCTPGKLYFCPKEVKFGWAWWFMSIMPAPERLRQEEQEFQIILSYCNETLSQK
jgi:hypothetical protein